MMHRGNRSIAVPSAMVYRRRRRLNDWWPAEPRHPPDSTPVDGAARAARGAPAFDEAAGPGTHPSGRGPAREGDCGPDGDAEADDAEVGVVANRSQTCSAAWVSGRVPSSSRYMTTSMSPC